MRPATGRVRQAPERGGRRGGKCRPQPRDKAWRTWIRLLAVLPQRDDQNLNDHCGNPENVSAFNRGVLPAIHLAAPGSFLEFTMDENADQRNSAAYRLAALDPDFLLGDSMRGVRLQLEYEKAEE